MFKYLAPDEGLWHIGEQCGEDTYLDLGNNLESFNVDIFTVDDYECGMFNGETLEYAKKWIEEHLVDKKEIL